MVALIRKLYQVERATQEKTPEQRKTIRHKLAEPILEKIKEWLDQKVVQVLPKSTLGEAISYTLGL